MTTRILLVEDDPLIVDALTRLPHELGLRVDTADTQTRAIELATAPGLPAPISSCCSTSPCARETASRCAPP